MNRRRFIHAGSALSASGLLGSLGALGAGEALGQSAASDYKALVCLFLFGGNDGNNTVVPTDNAGYAQYSAVRTSSSGVNLTQAELLPIQPRSVSTPFGLHPNLKELQTLFQQNKVAVLANVGTLVGPTTRDQYKAGQRPDSLYSHSDQQTQWQTSMSSEISRTGWGGRLADRLAGQNANDFPVISSTSGVTLFTTGNSSTTLSVPTSGTFGLTGFNGTAAANARLAALQQLLALDRENGLVTAASDITTKALSLSALVNPIISNSNSSIAGAFSGQNSSIAQQLLTIAKLIEARAATGAKRQVFFASLGGFDTHNNQLTTQQNLFGQLSPALKAFYDATVTLGVSDRVTTFTLSDFGRTFQPAAGGGSDHAWGNHQFIMGGAVKGGDLYGRFPTLVLNGPDDAEKEGRWVPTTSVDQYGATLASWLGASSTDLAAVFPNLAKFASPNLGFMT